MRVVPASSINPVPHIIVGAVLSVGILESPYCRDVVRCWMSTDKSSARFAWIDAVVTKETSCKTACKHEKQAGKKQQGKTLLPVMFPLPGEIVPAPRSAVRS